jgi:hypothetical protein
MTGHIEYIETLSLKEQFRLVEIAHETTNTDIRRHAIQLLQRYLNSVLITMAQCTPTPAPSKADYEALSKQLHEQQTDRYPDGLQIARASECGGTQ